MTSELIDTLLDQYWDVAFKEGSEGRVHDTQDGNAQSIRTQLIEAFNTRAAPDIPELVRYGAGGIIWGIDSPDGAQPPPNGEYVRYDQVAAMLAAKDAEIERLSGQCHDINAELQGVYERAEAAESKLAQIKAQVPVVWRGKFRANSSEFWEYYAHPDSGFDPNKYEQHPLYAAPVDQTAEIERLREGLRMAGELLENGGFDLDFIDTALSGKEPS